MRTKSGEVISVKEFFVRWKSGIMQMTPLQQLVVTFRSNWLIIIGILWGCFVTVYNSQWWLVVILLGSLLVTLVSQLGTYQRVKSLKMLDEQLGGELDVDAKEGSG